MLIGVDCSAEYSGQRYCGCATAEIENQCRSTCGLLNICGVEVSLCDYMSVFLCNATPKQPRGTRLSDCARATGTLICAVSQPKEEWNLIRDSITVPPVIRHLGPHT
jgi:hypothetical protein